MTAEPMQTTALQRFGHVLGWAGTAGAILCAGGAVVFLVDRELEASGIVAAYAVVLFLLGRALRYIFAGK